MDTTGEVSLMLFGDWPYWLTLGGMPGRQSAGSVWLAWAVLLPSLVIFLECLALGWYWWRQAKASASRAERRLCNGLAVACVVGGYTGWGFRPVMIFIPAWSLMLVNLGVMTAAMAFVLVYAWGRQAVFLDPVRAEAADELSDLHLALPVIQQELGLKLTLIDPKPVQDRLEQLGARLAAVTAKLRGNAAPEGDPSGQRDHP